MALACAVSVAAPAAFASEALTDVNIELRRFAVNAKGEALVSYTTAEGKTRNVLAWAGPQRQRP